MAPPGPSQSFYPEETQKFKYRRLSLNKLVTPIHFGRIVYYGVNKNSFMSEPLINITRKHALTFACFLVLYEFLTYIANDMIMPGMIQVIQSFHAPETAIATSLTAYILGGSSLQFFLGPLSDHYGRRPVMIFGAAFFFLFTVFIACANSMEYFLVARFFQGMGLCFISVIGYATLQEIFKEMDAVRLIAVMANVAILAPLLGPVLGALFIYYWSWRSIYVIISIFALVALWGLWHYMPESVGQIKQNGEPIKRSPLSPRSVILNYKNLVINPPVILGSIAIGLIALPCVTWIALAPIILIKQAHLSVFEYGLWQIPIFGASVLGNWVLHKLTHRGSLRWILVIGSFIAVLSLLLLYILPLLFSTHYLWLMPGLMLYFFGLSIVGAPLSRLILFSTPIAKGTTSALLSMVSSLTQALGIEVANMLYISHAKSNLIFSGYCAVIGIIYCIFLLGALTLSKTTSLKF